MPVAGLEPARLLNRLILSQVRLPIPPQRLILSDKKTFLSESAFLCYHIWSHFSTIFL